LAPSQVRLPVGISPLQVWTRLDRSSLAALVAGFSVMCASRERRRRNCA